MVVNNFRKTVTAVARPARRTVRQRFMTIAVPSVVVMVLAVMGGFAVFDLANDQRRLALRIDGVVQSQGAVVTDSLWHLNSESIDLILGAIAADPDIVSATVFDENESIVAQRNGLRGEESSGSRLYVVRQEIIHGTALSAQSIGRLEISYTDDRLWIEARQQLWIILLLAVLLSVATAFAASLANWRVIGMPLNRLLNAIKSTGSELPPAPVEWRADDEFGQVVQAFNDMREHQYEAEQSLIEVQRDLERRVDLRTQELRRARDEAEAASRAKSDFLRSMSHELRTPLNAILGFSELIRTPTLTPDADRHRDYATDIHKSAGFLLDLVNDLLDISRLETETYVVEDEDFVLDDMINDAVGIIKGSAASKRIKVSIENTTPGVICNGDRRMLKQAVMNILGNAVKFTDTAGEISVTANVDADGTGIIAVSDNGRGISTQDISLVFDAFSRIDDPFIRTEQGTGLGLPLSRFLVERHGGTIAIQSDVGVGTTLTVRIPAHRITVDKSESARA